MSSLLSTVLGSFGMFSKIETLIRTGKDHINNQETSRVQVMINSLKNDEQRLSKCIDDIEDFHRDMFVLPIKKDKPSDTENAHSLKEDMDISEYSVADPDYEPRPPSPQYAPISSPANTPVYKMSPEIEPVYEARPTSPQYVPISSPANTPVYKMSPEIEPVYNTSPENEPEYETMPASPKYIPIPANTPEYKMSPENDPEHESMPSVNDPLSLNHPEREPMSSENDPEYEPMSSENDLENEPMSYENYPEHESMRSVKDPLSLNYPESEPMSSENDPMSSQNDPDYLVVEEDASLYEQNSSRERLILSNPRSTITISESPVYVPSRNEPDVSEYEEDTSLYQPPMNEQKSSGERLILRISRSAITSSGSSMYATISSLKEPDVSEYEEDSSMYQPPMNDQNSSRKSMILNIPKSVITMQSSKKEADNGFGSSSSKEESGEVEKEIVTSTLLNLMADKESKVIKLVVDLIDKFHKFQENLREIETITSKSSEFFPGKSNYEVKVILKALSEHVLFMDISIADIYSKYSEILQNLGKKFPPK